MASIIQHRGIVENIDGSQVRVRIVQTSACSACSVKGHCGSADSKEKIVDVIDETHSYKIGDAVMVIGQTSMGMQAVLIAFVIPFIILISALFISISLTDGNEALSSIISLAMLIPYYIFIWLGRKKLKKNFSFTIKPIK